MTATEPGLSVDLFGKLNLTLGGLKSEMAGVRHALDRPPAQPFTIAASGDVTTPAATTFPIAIGLGGPQQGQVWDVRNIAIGGAFPTDAVSGRADIYVRGDNLTAHATRTFAQIGMIGWRDQATALPLVAYYGRGQILVRAQQRLWVVLSSYTVSKQYTVNAEIEQFEEGAILQTADR